MERPHIMRDLSNIPAEDFPWDEVERIELSDGRIVTKQQFFNDMYEAQFSHPDPAIREIAGNLVAKRYKSYGDTPYDVIVGSFLNK